MASLMDQARTQRGQQPEGGGGGALKVPDWHQFTPPELQDEVERIVAAGSKLMYSPEMQQERTQAVTANAPVGETLADNVVGLMLVLDQQAKPNGLPVAALFPALIGLLAEAVNVMEAAGKKVTQEDWEDAWARAYVIMAKKLGASDEQIMQEAQKWEGGDAQAAPQGQPMPPGGAPGGQPPAAPAAAAPPEEDEEAAMARGMA